MAAPRRLSAHALLALLALLAACATDAPTGATAARPSAAITPPAAGAAIGVAIDGAPLGKPGLAAWDKWTTAVGRKPLYAMWFADWSTGFQGYAVTNAYAKGARPVITWEMKNRSRDISYADVLAGKWDRYIDGWAAAAKADGREIMLRFGHEMNGDWYGWSGARNGGGTAAADRFVATWRHVHDRFARVGATNVTWAWCVNHESVPAVDWNEPRMYYPGDAYVDWTCADGYNWGTSQTLAANGWTSRWQSFDEVFGGVYARVAAVAPAKPFMIGEFASSESGGDKAAWIADAALRMQASGYANLRLAIWFDYLKETDWRVASSPASLQAFRTSFGGSHFVWQR